PLARLVVDLNENVADAIRCAAGRDPVGVDRIRGRWPCRPPRSPSLLCKYLVILVGPLEVLGMRDMHPEWRRGKKRAGDRCIVGTGSSATPSLRPSLACDRDELSIHGGEVRQVVDKATDLAPDGGVGRDEGCLIQRPRVFGGVR